jgi:hypothetical protein
MIDTGAAPTAAECNVDEKAVIVTADFRNPGGQRWVES